MRRTSTTLLMTAALLLTLALPATAQASFFGTATAEPDVDVTLRVQAPPAEGKRTRKLVITAPSGFTVLEAGCAVPATLTSAWTCSIKGRAVTYVTEDPAALHSNIFTLTVHTPNQGGQFPFTVDQTYKDDSAESFRGETAPVLTVTEPAPEPTPAPTESSSPEPTPEPTQAPATKAPTKPTKTTAPKPAATTAPAASEAPSSSDGTTTTGSGRTTQTAGGSAGPSRTTSGTTFDVTPGGSIAAGDGADAPDIAAPDVAVAQPIDPDDPTVELEVEDASTDDEPGGALRWVGLGLVGIGGGTALLRRRMAAS